MTFNCCSISEDSATDLGVGSDDDCITFDCTDTMGKENFSAHRHVGRHPTFLRIMLKDPSFKEIVERVIRVTLVAVDDKAEDDITFAFVCPDGIHRSPAAC